MVQSVQVFQQQALIESLQVLDAESALFLGQAGLFPGDKASRSICCGFTRPQESSSFFVKCFKCALRELHGR